jgi:hypothetical protein
MGGSWRLGGGGGVAVFCVMIPCRMVVAIDFDTDTDFDFDFDFPILPDRDGLVTHRSMLIVISSSGSTLEIYSTFQSSAGRGLPSDAVSLAQKAQSTPPWVILSSSWFVPCLNCTGTWS